MTVRLSRKERIGLYLHRTLDRRFSPLGVAVYQRTRGNIVRPWHVDVLVLTTVGRRTGQRRRVMLQFFHDGDDMLLVAADGGADHHPAWYHNLKAEPAAEAEIMGETVAVVATELTEAEAEVSWPGILERSPDYERYRRATDRTMPLIRLTRT